nr:reverse transcriptase domain-containing protein [Tanacetum cinerariifolium]
MSTQQDIYAAGSESHPLMLNKENYVPWSSCLLCYAKSRPNGKLIHNSIINGLYVRRMIPEPGDTNWEVLLNETFHVQTDDELTEKELKQIEADDQAIQTILLGLPEDIYAAIDSCEIAQEIWFTSNEGESIESYYHRFLKLMNDLKRNKHFPEKIASNLKFLNNLQPEWSRHVTIVHQTKDLHIADYSQLYDFLKYNQKEVDELKAKRLAKIQDPLALMANFNNPYMISSNPRNRQIAQPGMNMGQDRQIQMVGGNDGNQFRQYAGQNVRNLTGYNDVQNVRNQVVQNVVQNPRVQNIGNQNGLIGVLRNANLNGNGNLVAAHAEGNAVGHNGNQIRCYNCKGVGIQLQAEEYDLMADAADLDEIEEVNTNCILMANLQHASTLVEQHPVNFKETRALYDSLYHNLAIEVEKVNSVNRKLKETNVDLTTELAIFKNQEKYDKLERCYQQSVYQEQCLSKKINALHLNTEKKRLESDFKTREDELLDKKIQLEKKIKELNNILVKTGQSIQTIHMLSPKPDSFYHTKQKMASGYQNPFYLKQAQKKQQSLYDGKVLLKMHDPLVVHDSEETLQLAQESREKMKQLNKEIKPVKNTIVTLQRVVEHRMTLDTHSWSSSAHQELHKIAKDENFPIVNQVDARVQNFEIQFFKEATKLVEDFKSLAKEADDSLAKHKALELEIKRLLRAVVSQDIMFVVQKTSVVDASNLQTELDRTKERFENCIIKKENEYARLLNDWYKKCDECKYDKISYDKAYNDMKHKIERLQAQLGDLKGKTKDTSCVSDTQNPLSQKLERIDNTKTRRPQPRSNTKNDRVPSASKSSQSKNKGVEVEEHHRNLLLSKNTKHMSSACNNIKLDSQNVISKVVNAMYKQCLIYVNHDVCLRNYVNGKNSRGCSKHMTGNLKLLINFVWKFMGTVCFKNDHVAAILGFGDLQWGNILITMVYFVEGLGHNLFSVGQLCDSDLEAAFRRNACFVRNLEGVDLLKGDRSTNLYTINLHKMASASPICLMARASSTKSWLWHQRLSHLNFDTINDLARNDLVSGENRASWSDKLDDTLWAFHTAFKTSIGCTPYKLAYENSLIYKEKTKRIHNSKIKDRVFNVGDRVLLFNSRLNIFSGKLKTRWTVPFTVTQVFPYGTVELSQTDGPNFKVNGHRLKHYFGRDIPSMVVPNLQTFPKDN